MGNLLGLSDGFAEGDEVGIWLGILDGLIVGDLVGFGVGTRGHTAALVVSNSS